MKLICVNELSLNIAFEKDRGTCTCNLYMGVSTPF